MLVPLGLFVEHNVVQSIYELVHSIYFTTRLKGRIEECKSTQSDCDWFGHQFAKINDMKTLMRNGKKDEYCVHRRTAWLIRKVSTGRQGCNRANVAAYILALWLA